MRFAIIASLAFLVACGGSDDDGDTGVDSAGDSGASAEVVVDEAKKN